MVYVSGSNRFIRLKTLEKQASAFRSNVVPSKSIVCSPRKTRLRIQTRF